MGADLACVWRVLNESSRTFAELGLQTAAGNCTRAADVVSNAQAALARAEAVAQAAVAAERERDEARKSIAAYPKTVDGIVMFPGMCVVAVDPATNKVISNICVELVGLEMECIDPDTDAWGPTDRAFGPCYLFHSHDAACAAAKAGEGT